MLRDVFYYGSKPNTHPREKRAIDLADARNQCTTEHFWIINEYCDYTNFDWDWDFDFLPDEEVWTSEHNNVWPNNVYKDSGTWLCPKQDTDVIIYRADVTPIHRKNTKNENWIVLEKINELAFNFGWEPSPYDPPYIYKWGCKYYPPEIKHYVEYHVKDATTVKYMHDIVELLPEWDKWVKVQEVDMLSFDFSWRPDPREPAFIYVWGNTQYPSNIMSTIEYHCPGATEKKYMNDVVATLTSNKESFTILENIVLSSFDFSWRPDPTSPPYIYVWGNKWVSGKIKSTIEYHCPDATEKKYMNDLVEVLPELDKWVEYCLIDKNKFDFSWRPKPTSPPYIYVWGNKWVPGEIKPTIEYHCPGATEYSYMNELVEVLPELDKWVEYCLIDKNKFDFSWRPNPTSPPYIYVWGNKWVSGEIKPTIEYHCPGATEYSYMNELVEVLPELDKWVEVQLIDTKKFDLTWRPDPREPDYIYVWGNKWIPGEIKSTIEYHCPGATDKKYMDESISVLPNKERWNVVQEVLDFDFSWRPDPREPDYIYVWGNKWIPGEIKSTIEYHCPGATDKKYMDEVQVLPEHERWVEYQPVDTKKFDLTWRPDPREPAYIYVWGNKWIPGEIKPTIEYHCPGATDKKYMDEPVEVLPISDNWKIIQNVVDFDFSWRPDPREPDYIYVWGNKYIAAELQPTIEYHCDNASSRKYMGIVDVAPEWDKWNIIIPIDKTSFDFSWRPDPREPAYIYVWGNKFNDAVREPTIQYHCLGATDYKYMYDVVATPLPDMQKWTSLIPVDSFDYSWRPDPKNQPYVYIFGNKWNDAATEPTLSYKVDGATEIKYINDIVATPRPELNFWQISNNDDLETFDFSWRPNPYSPPQIYQWEDNGPRYSIPGATEVVFMERIQKINNNVISKYTIKTTLEDLIAEHPEEVFWAINPDLRYEKFDFSWRPDKQNFRHINVFGNEYSKNTHTYYVNGPMYTAGHREFNYVDNHTFNIDSNLSMFFVDRSNDESSERFEILKQRYPKIQKTRYLNSWVDTINRCVNKSETDLSWILNSELDYTDFIFDYYPSPWQQTLVHVFGTQWSQWGSTYMVNKKTFTQDAKYIKQVEHLNRKLNFVKSKKAKATNCLYDVWLIDYATDTTASVKTLLENKVKKTVSTVLYENDYLTTLKKLLNELLIKKDHYIWVCSSICDYTNFDFTYICDPFSLEQLHVFPSDKQKYGDTFFINVNRLRSLVEELDNLENINKINFNQHQQVKRLPAPNFITESDTHVSVTNNYFDWPYATFVTADNKEINVIDHEPISLWSKESKNILITSTGGTRIVVPKEAKEYVKKELYDYPYIAKSTKMGQSKPLDIVFLSNGETGADENYEHLLNVTKGLSNRVVRVDGVNGRVASYHAAAKASNTPWMFTVFAKLKVNSKFDWTWQPDRLQVPKHYIFHATNPVNNLEYGHQAMIAYNKKITLANTGRGLDFTLDDEHEVVEMNSGVARYNTDEFSTWRTSFREAIKLRADDSQVSKDRLDAWLNIGEGDFAQYSCEGAQHAVEYYESVKGDLDKLRLSYDWPWLQEYFNTKYN